MSVLVRIPVPAHLPTAPCCNCGRTDDLVQRRLSLEVGTSAGVAGTRRTIHLDVPTCAACQPTLQVQRPRLLVAGLVLTLLTLLVALLPMIRLDDPMLFAAAFVGVVIVGMGLPQGVERLRRPPAPVTSRSCPVEIIDAEGVLGEPPTALSLALTQPAYARALADANGVAVRSMLEARLSQAVRLASPVLIGGTGIVALVAGIGITFGLLGDVDATWADLLQIAGMWLGTVAGSALVWVLAARGTGTFLGSVASLARLLTLVAAVAGLAGAGMGAVTALFV